MWYESNLRTFQSKITTPEIELGQGVTLKSQRKISIQKLKLVTKYNVSDIFTDEWDLLKKLNDLKNSFILTSSVPSFTPTGEWDIIFI
jgi:hypothetical protein